MSTPRTADTERGLRTGPTARPTTSWRSRGSWADKATTFVGFKAGSPGDSHAQADAGSFVLDADGVRWVVDLGPDNYNLPGYFDRDRGRWRFYVNRAEGHNTLVIAPDAEPDQDPRSRSTITKFDHTDRRTVTIADLTPAYRGRASHVARGIALFDRRNVLVQDNVREPTGDVWWFMHTPAEITVANDKRSATLRLGERTLRATILAPQAAAFTVRPAKPFETSPRVPGQADLDDLRKLAIHLVKPAGNTTIVVWFTPGDGVVPAPDFRSLETW